MRLLIVLGVGLAIFLILHVVWYIKPDASIETRADLENKLYDGHPTIIELYSNW